MSGHIPKLRDDCIFERAFDGTLNTIEHRLSVLNCSLVSECGACICNLCVGDILLVYQNVVTVDG